MKFNLLSIAILIAMFSCVPKQQVDLIVYNATIYTVDEDFNKIDAFAVTNGKFVATGSNKDIFSKYKSKNIFDAKGQTIIPGLINSYSYFYGLGLSKQRIDLNNTKSFEDVVNEVINFKKEKNSDFILGRGWDHRIWKSKKLPAKYRLDELFPDTPVVLYSKDAYRLLANQAALDLAGIDVDTTIEGGDIIKKAGSLTGVISGNAKNLVINIIPAVTVKKSIHALKDAEKYCLKQGFTTIDEAGIDKDIINLIDSLQLIGELNIRIYAMVNANKKNLNYYLKNGIFKSDRLNVRSFKVFADGPLGTRGAALKESYSDRRNYFGGMINNPDSIVKTAHRIIDSDFQMNTYAIGDSANSFMLKTYANTLKSQTNRRWRIEHAQVISEEDFDYFTEIIASVQPTHAISDIYSPKERLGSERIKGAFAYKKLLEANGKVALGTDFTNKNLSPMFTFYAAVARKDLSGFPKGGFELENGLTREEALKGMTIWAAFANFEEEEKGSIEVDKFADFIVLDNNIMEVNLDSIPKIKVIATYLDGEKMYE